MVRAASTDGQAEARRPLDRAKWRQPLCSVIVTHHNYSHLVEDTLLSLLDQTHENWECIVVDDFSGEDERRRLLEIVEGLSDPRIRAIQNAEQLGQIETFFAGFAETTGEFVSPLDPDDRLGPTYLEEMLRAHLNEEVFCPIVTCDQKLFRIDGALLTGIWKGRRQGRDRSGSLSIDLAKPAVVPLRYFPPLKRDWIWTSSSAMMVRRSALDLLVPNKRLGFNRAVDAYLANGAHFLGGTLFLPKPLIYRGIHSKNWYLAESIISMEQTMRRAGWITRAPQSRREAIEAMFHGGVTNRFSEDHLAKVLRTHFDKDQVMLIAKTCPEAYRLWRLAETN